MKEDSLKRTMTFIKDGVEKTPLFVMQVDNRFILAAYRGSFSKYDILVKYKQKVGEKWSRIRTPKHIHWAVDVLIKMYKDKKQTERFLNFLIEVWNETKPVKDLESQREALNLENLLKINQKEINQYTELNKEGEYSVTFLILLAKLLMIQEKTNLESAYMFKKLLNALKEGEDIFKIISIATHRGR